jgi:hypothetical protein
MFFQHTSIFYVKAVERERESLANKEFLKDQAGHKKNLMELKFLNSLWNGGAQKSPNVESLERYIYFLLPFCSSKSVQ